MYASLFTTVQIDYSISDEVRSFVLIVRKYFELKYLKSRLI